MSPDVPDGLIDDLGFVSEQAEQTLRAAFVRTFVDEDDHLGRSHWDLRGKLERMVRPDLYAQLDRNLLRHR
jgi:hypothetical protein